VGSGGVDALEANARTELTRARLVAGGRRLLADAGALLASEARTVELAGDLEPALDALAADPGPVCVLASGDPGFFGIVRPLAARFGPERLRVYPAPSSVALAFARLGCPWDDAIVVSAHGRPLADAAVLAAAAPKAAVLTSPDTPPQTLGRALIDRGVGLRDVAVCSRLGAPDEAITRTDLAGLAAGSFDPLSVVVLLTSGGAVASRKSLAWGLPDEAFAHRDGMLTKSEVRALVVGRLDVPATGVLWDVGAGSGSVAIECARLAPELEVHAVERRPDDAARIMQNARAHGAAVHVTQGNAPEVLTQLPDPDRVFVGGGGIAVLDAVLARLQAGGRIVATYAAIDRAAAAAERLGAIVQLSVSRGTRLPDGTFRLAAENPVFVAWAPA
jgi:precorrin-6Y C5,15-methyltransferase (decarboxylating)